MRDERRSSGSSVALNAAICPDLSAASPVHSRPRTAASSKRRALVTASVLAAIALCLTAYVGTFEVSPLAFGRYCVGVVVNSLVFAACRQGQGGVEAGVPLHGSVVRDSKAEAERLAERRAGANNLLPRRQWLRQAGDG